MATNEMADAANDLLGLPSRLRIVTIFALWWEELDRVLYTDTNQASRCLHHISRILEDATYVGDKRGDGEMLEDDEDEDDLEMLSARLVKIVIQEFGDIAESCFRHMQTATDMLFLRAGTRFLISYKQACWKTFDDFYIIFPSDQLEMFLTERAMTDDVLLASRLAFLAGELIEETDAQSPVAPTDILDMIIRRFKEAKQALQERIPDLIEFVKRLPSKAYYIKDSSIPIPVPEDASSASVEWDTDDANVSDSVEFLLTKAIGNLRLLAAIADYTEVLHPCVEASIVESCLQLLSFPHFTIQIYALGWFSTALIHKKIATDFVDMNGISIVMEFTKENKDVENRLQLLAPYVSYIMVALSKHGPAIQSLVTDETFANKFIQFGLSFLADTGVDTQLNIIEWLGECFNHPCLLRTIHQVNVLPILTKAMHRALSSDSEDNMASMQLQLRREIMKSMLKFIAVNLFWAVQYSKSISVDALTSSDNNNVMNSILSSPSKKFFSTLASSSSTNSLNKDASAATASASLPGGINGPHILGSYSGITKVSDDDLTELEMYALQMLMKNDQLPVGMCSNLFGIMDPYQQDEEAVGDVLGAVGGMGSMEDDNMSLASQVKKVFPEWTIAKLFMKFKVIPVLLQTIIVEVKDTITLCTALYILELLCLDAAAIVEIQQTIPNKSLPNNEEEAAQDDANPLEGKKGLEILLATISNPSRKDPAVISATLKTLSAMCTPPHFRYKGSSVQVAKSLFEDMMFSNGGAGIGATAANTANNSKRRLDTSTKKHYVIHRDLTTNLEQVQSTIRTSIRSYSGINSLMQLIYYRKNQLFAITVRLETVRVLLGMAQDAEIKLILSKMRIPAIVENQVRAETNQLNYLEVNANVSGKSSEKALLELYCDILSSQLSNYTPGSSNMALMERNLDATQDALERKAIVDHSRIEFSEVELMQLIKEHLASKGLCKTVSAMEEELKDIDVGSKKTLTFVPLTVAATATLATPSVESKKRLREVTSLPSSASGNALAGSSSSNIHGIAASPDDVVSDSKKVKRQLSHDLESERTVPSAVSSNQSNAHTTSASNHHSAAVSVNGIVYKLPVPISKAQRKRNISRALKQSSSAVVRTTNPAMESTVLSKDRSSSSAALFSPPASHSTRHHLKTAQSTVTHTQHLQSRSNIASNSKLHNIMQRYLKLQHSQCKHPITTLPVLSLTKPHVCARPSPPQFQNISSILNYHNSMRNTWWFTHNRAEVHNSTMQYLYSSYKPIRSIRQIENASTISASSFARDNSKLWVAYYEEWQTDGPGIALLDIEQGTELSLSGLDLDGVISRFVLSPKQSKTSPFIITSLCEYLQYQNFAMDHELYLWKDTNDLEVFNAPYLRKFEVFDEQNMALPEEDRESIRFIGEVFQPSGHHLAALSKGMTASSMEQYNAMCSAHILDIETGAVLQTVKNEGTDNTYTIPSIAYVEHDENLFFMDGKLWDLRLQHVIHRFDKLSFAGNTSVHPYKYEAIIDNAVWDLRTFGLRQTVPLLEGCKVKFDAAGNVLFGYRSLDEERQEFKMNLSHAIEDNNFFHVMNTSDYSHIHTELIDKENMLLWDLDVDRDGCGYMNTLMFSNHFSESICRIFEIGKRKKTLGSGDSDDDEEEEEDGDDDWSSHGDDDDDEHDGEVEEDEDDDDMDGSSDADDDLDDDSVDDDDDGFGSDSSEEENEEGPEVGDGGLDVEDEEYDSEDDSDFEEGEEDEQDDEEGWETLSEESI